MPQVKKAGRREAILQSAFASFSEKGYSATTMTDIARGAGVTVANLYVYFDSKLIILYELYEPWLIDQLQKLRASVALTNGTKRKVQRILMGIWADIPAADKPFANALIDALASAPATLAKPNNLLVSVEAFLTQLLSEVLPPERRVILEDDLFSHIVWMAFDGFVINHRIGDDRDMQKLTTLITTMLLGDAADAGN